jgi:23S rRNA (uracil-5-)-methyltransferase RumA
MIARHDGAIALVAACIPGEVVEATVEKVQRGTIWAKTTRVLEPSADRVQPEGDWSCGGNVFAHIRYDRQLVLKRDILRDAFTRIGHLPIPDNLTVVGSPADGYRMRARLHVRHGRIGFFREGTHDLCDPAPTRQLLPATITALQQFQAALATLSSVEISQVEISENRSATERAFHLDLSEDANQSRVGALPRVADVTGVSYGETGSHRSQVIWGIPFVSDVIEVPAQNAVLTVSLTRHAHSFFQGNRFLLPGLMAAVVDAALPGNVLDLYAGVGLFAVSLAVGGGRDVIAIEGDRRAADDLRANTAAFGSSVSVRHQSVETFLAVAPPSDVQTVIVDPPRTGMSKDALSRVIGLGAKRVVYVSCDVATLARDARLLADGGYRLSDIRAFDLFPNTAHVETLGVFDRGSKKTATRDSESL